MIPCINFYYNKTDSLPQHEIISKSLCMHASHVMQMPSQIDICFYQLQHSVYGGIDKKKANRLVIDYHLNLKQLPQILVHELIHINQRYTGALEITKDGWYIWQKKFFLKSNPQELTYEQYLNLPWEVDVQCRLHTTLKKILDLAKIT
jgi:hypothetical protein